MKAVEAKTTKATKDFEPTYTINELAAASSEFNTSSIVVRAALTRGKKDAYTIKEATQLIERMKNKEVKS